MIFSSFVSRLQNLNKLFFRGLWRLDRDAACVRTPNSSHTHEQPTTAADSQRPRRRISVSDILSLPQRLLRLIYSAGCCFCSGFGPKTAASQNKYPNASEVQGFADDSSRQTGSEIFSSCAATGWPSGQRALFVFDGFMCMQVVRYALLPCRWSPTCTLDAQHNIQHV